MKEKKTKKNKRRSISKEIEELEERLKETGSLREQAVMSALIVENVKTEAGRRIIFNTTQEIVGAMDWVMNLGETGKNLSSFSNNTISSNSIRP